MATKAIVGILGLVVGTAFILIALLRTSLPRHKRLMFIYSGVCLYAFGALEYFSIIHLESLR
jgi:hypothetical protein